MEKPGKGRGAWGAHWRWMLAVAVLGVSIVVWRMPRRDNPIRVGILHSRTGPMAISEQSMVDAELLAIEEINARGGLLGRRLEPVIADGASDWPTFAREAERLITQERVDIVFGCWTSASRKTVLPVFERNNHLLVYPMAYEGLEQSPNIIYTGAAPNQQIIPALKWSLDNLGPRVFLVGSDYVWPHSINAIMSDVLPALGATLVGEDYVFFGSDKVQRVVEAIVRAHPDVIISAVVGESNIAFYQALHDAGITPDKVPVVSVSIGEEELRTLSRRNLAGQYLAWNYFQSMPRAENATFVEAFRLRYGADRVTSDVIETSYFSVHLWAGAVREAGSTDVNVVREAMLGQSFNAPEGIVSIDPATRHTWRSFAMGRVREDGQIDVVWSAEKPIRPVPYPTSRSRRAWESYLADLNTRWGGAWANPVESR
jgi:urea transport system substrate-binding protein